MAVYPHPGKLVFVDRSVDAHGHDDGRASFANADQIVRPGQYARIRATVDTRRALLVRSAVQEVQGVSVMVVTGDNVAGSAW